MTGSPAPAATIKRPRDLRLDFFRGLAMFIILVAHTPGNSWTLWIPARFGYSDAAEIFVFCSGMASAMAFGSTYVARGWLIGAARVAFRVWQVYWAHIGVILVTTLLMILLDRSGMGPEGRAYTNWWPVSGFFRDAEAALLGYFTLTYVPGLFDILPMYLAILAMIPVIMLAHHLGGRMAVFGVVAAVWFAAQLAIWRYSLGGEETHALGEMLATLGGAFSFMSLPSNPWGKGTWFFNPFGWQIVFFTGFALGMKWLTPPPVTRGLVLAAAGYLIVSIPFAWHKIHGVGYLPEDWVIRVWIADARNFLGPLIGKAGVGPLRYLHFLAIAYLAWAAVGPDGARLRSGWRPPRAILDKAWLAALVGLALLTAPYAYVDEIRALSPALDSWLLAVMGRFGLIADPGRIGVAQLAHLGALIVLIWSAIGPERRAWVTGEGFLAIVPVIRKVGTQSLAVFMVSIVLGRFNGWWLDVIGRDVWTYALVNLTGFAALVATAYVVGWFKAEPWRRVKERHRDEAPARVAASRTPAE
ncbi:OpgC family protein [Pikeienuella sp. HZG-20]|uniref:OpgC family protein n=1 Tax=Paludibacillus litoralis TaxID=3133267 RepID=UPI0030EDA552